MSGGRGLTHEMKGPLAAIRGSAELLEGADAAHAAAPSADAEGDGAAAAHAPMDAADRALYRSKQAGRNRVTVGVE